MHIPDGFLDVKTAVGTGVVSLVSLRYALSRVRETLGDRRVPLMGVTAAFIFAAQMINFSVLPGASGHILGAVLAAILLGPWAAMITMTTVVFIQFLFFQDGGLTALGANVLNMAVIAPLAGYLVYTLITKLAKGRAGTFVASFTAAWVSVMLTSAAAGLQLAISGTVPWQVVLPALLFWHALIGLGEGLVTGAVLIFLAKVRSDLVLPSSEVCHEKL